MIKIRRARKDEMHIIKALDLLTLGEDGSEGSAEEFSKGLWWLMFQEETPIGFGGALYLVAGHDPVWRASNVRDAKLVDTPPEAVQRTVCTPTHIEITKRILIGWG